MAVADEYKLNRWEKSIKIYVFEHAVEKCIHRIKLKHLFNEDDLVKARKIALTRTLPYNGTVKHMRDARAVEDQEETLICDGCRI